MRKFVLKCHNLKLLVFSKRSARFSHFVCTSTEGAEFAFWFAGVVGWPRAVNADDDPGLENCHAARRAWRFLAFKHASYKPQRRLRFRQMKFFAFSKQSLKLA